MKDNPNYGALDNLAVAGFVLAVILGLVKYTRGFVSNIAVLLGIVAGCIAAMAMGKMNFDKVATRPTGLTWSRPLPSACPPSTPS